MPHSADFQIFLDIFVHFYAFTGFFLKIHSHGEAIFGPFWPSSLLLHYHFVSCCTYILLLLSDFDVCFGMEI